MPDIATAALIRKRAELAGEIEAQAATLSQLRADLVHLDAAIRIMSPDTDPEAIRPKKPSGKGCDWFGRGELARMVLDVLREAQGPLGHAEIARAIMERKGLPVGDAVAVKRVAGMVKGRCIGGRGGSRVGLARSGSDAAPRFPYAESANHQRGKTCCDRGS